MAERHNQRSGIGAQTGNSGQAKSTRTPGAQGLYDPINEHDSCGVGMIASINNDASHSVVENGLEMLVNLTHRGAVGADPLMGDGAGMLLQIPHKFLAKNVDFKLPEPGRYAVAMVFYPQDESLRARCDAAILSVLDAENLEYLGRRTVPFDQNGQSELVIAAQPHIEQLFIACPDGIDVDTFERDLLIARKMISNVIVQDIPEANKDDGFYIVSMSARTIVYKGMFLAYQLGAFYPDLHDADFESAMVIVHQRFSTNTFPTWDLAHPFRMIAHNGEINTLRGNV
ncbi:MAG: glutamate synthase subunit alpha, partial [Hyphomicrobiaceae bacterium]|nr:glutamate synthase subunit alpha [Hyphomicrobiaceae bacterium]